MYRHDYVNNPYYDRHLIYDVLYHTDLSRDKGTSNGIDLALNKWENYDLVVIDESHNFVMVDPVKVIKRRDVKIVTAD